MSRQVKVSRTTQETSISLTLDLDQFHDPQIDTSVPLLSHFLTAFTFHGRFGMTLQADGDIAVDPHHLVEDVGLVLGQALTEALGDRRNITRFGQQYVPMDEALVLCALDLSGRGQCYWGPGFPDRDINGTSAEVWPEFFHGFARRSGTTLHLRYIAGDNAHHVYEAVFKAFGRALAEAVTPLETGGISSTKGVL